MHDEAFPLDGRLRDASAALRGNTIRPDVLRRGRDVVSARFRRKNRRKLFRIAGLAGAAAVAGIVLLELVPSHSAAADLLDAVERSRGVLIHRVMYGLVDGKAAPSGEMASLGRIEIYADGTRFKLISPLLGMFTFGAFAPSSAVNPDDFPPSFIQIDSETKTMSVYEEGVLVTLPAPANDILPGFAKTAEQLLAELKTEKPLVTVERGVLWKGLRVDRYSLKTSWDMPLGNRAKGASQQTVVIVDPKKNLPMEQIDGPFDGNSYLVTDFDYTTPKEDPFTLPSDAKTRVFNEVTDRQELLQGFEAHGPKVKVGGAAVELVELWADEEGAAAAIVRGPIDPPDGLTPSDTDGRWLAKPVGARLPFKQPSQDPNSLFGQNAISADSTTYDGRPILVFEDWHNSFSPGPSYDALADVEIPVFKRSRMLGWARFHNVPVHHTYSLRLLLRNLGESQSRLFWDDSQG